MMQFYLSGPLPCPYLPGQVERKLFTRLTGNEQMDVEINAALTRAGFRRSHDIVYRPACNECNACVPVRIPVETFKLTRSMRRIQATNRDLTLDVTEPEFTNEIYELFRDYQAERHPDGDMAHMSIGDFTHMLREGESATQVYRLKTPTGKILGAVITDHVSDGLSAVYSFFNPEEERRSPGVELILRLIGEAKSKNLPYVYLGYWIAASRKMSYKARFQPLQALGPQGWEWMKP